MKRRCILFTVILLAIFVLGNVVLAGQKSAKCDTDVRRGPSVECGVGVGILVNHTIRTYDAKVCGKPVVNGDNCTNKYSCVVKITTEYSRDGKQPRCTKVTSTDATTISGCCCVIYDP